jgi:hypothetical protein
VGTSTAQLPDRIRGARAEFDLTDPADQENVLELAEDILRSAPPSFAAFEVARADAPLEARMAAVLEEEIEDHHDLGKLIDVLPPEFEAADEADYGDPACMPPQAVREWIRATCGPRSGR